MGGRGEGAPMAPAPTIPMDLRNWVAVGPGSAYVQPYG